MFRITEIKRKKRKKNKLKVLWEKSGQTSLAGEDNC